MVSSIQSIGISIWRALPGVGPLFDDSIDATTEVEVEASKEVVIFPGDQLIPDLVTHVFTFLPFKDLVSASKVSTVWRDLASSNSVLNVIELEQIPRVTVMNQAFVEEHVDTATLRLNFDGLPKVHNCDLIPILKRLLAPGVIEGDAGVTVLTMPGGLDWDKLSTLAQNPKKGHPTQFSDIYPDPLRRLREIPASKACIFIIPNNVLSGSRMGKAEAHKELVRRIGADMPEVLPMATLAILTHISTGTRLFGDKPWTYVRCLETVKIDDVEYWIFVGGFAPGGLGVYCVFGDGVLGVVAMYKFPAIGASNQDINS